jgi:mRNA-degrading endonuclease toxin of MazEF toxin-antitoxin module
MNGEELPYRGDVWWLRMDKRRPGIVVQADTVREARVRSFLVVPLTSRLHLEDLPGNVRLETSASGLSRASVANVYDVQKVLRSDLLDRFGRLPREDQERIDRGLRLVLGI